MAKIKLFLLLFMFSAAAFVTRQAFATTENNHQTKRVVLNTNEVVQNDYFAVGEVVEIHGTVKGDLYAVGGQVFVDGTVEGDILAAAGTIVIDGTIGDDARLVGGEITISGSLGDNLTIASGNINLLSSAQVQGSIVGAAGSIHMNAPIQKDITIAAGQIIIGNNVTGNATLAAEDIEVTSQAIVQGNVNYWSSNDLLLSDGATISGNVQKHATPRVTPSIEKKDAQKIMASMYGAFKLFTFISNLITLIVVGMFAQKYFPHILEEANEKIHTQALGSLAYGLLAHIGIPFIAMLLLITLIGIPLAGILFLVFLLLMVLSEVVIAYWIGNRIVNRNTDKGNAGAYLIGAFLLALVTAIPFLGAIINCVASAIGLGALVLAREKKG